MEVGLADAGMVALPYNPGKLPLGNRTYAVPFGPGDPYVILEAAQRLYEEVPALREEIEAYNLVFLAPSVIDTYNLTSKEPIVTFEDFYGIEIASVGSYHPKPPQGAGATAIAMPVADRYQALQTGVIEAEFLPWDISHAYKYHDFNKNITWADMGAAMPVGLGVNKDTWDSLPADLQQLIGSRSPYRSSYSPFGPALITTSKDSRSAAVPTGAGALASWLAWAWPRWKSWLLNQFWNASSDSQRVYTK